MLIIGGGKRAKKLLEIIKNLESLEVIGIVDPDPDAPAIIDAKKLNITTPSEWSSFIDNNVDVVIDTTHDLKLSKRLFEDFNHTYIMPSELVHILSGLFKDKEDLIEKLSNQSSQEQLILELTQDAMIAVDKEEAITIFNTSAEIVTGLKREHVIGQKISRVMPFSKLPRVLKTGEREVNQEQELENGRKIITTRLPIEDQKKQVTGAFAVFRDVTDVINLAEEVTNLKSIRTMLNAIIDSFEEAISVVDESGKGLMINPAYTKLTGLSEKDIIGQPATADISEGESMHMKVLNTRKPVRGERMKVGPRGREVIVNVAPIIINGILKGSVGVLHDVSELTSLTSELNRARQIIRNLETKYTFEDIIGSTNEMMLVKQQAQLAANTNVIILLRGESGTGKELFAHAIHNVSSRKFNKFIRVNCASVSEAQLERELFGIETNEIYNEGFAQGRGVFEEANKGSIFLDEIGELSLPIQAKLLRVLQEQKIFRIGGKKAIPIDVRIIAATNINLEKRIGVGKFREDLYYRLNRMPIFIPPLRRRMEDLSDLCRSLIKRINQDYGRNVKVISQGATNRLMAYDWPGNIRELENVLARAVINMEIHETTIMTEHVPSLNGQPSKHEVQTSLQDQSFNLSKKVDDFEKQLIKETLLIHDLNKTRTAKFLGISVRNLYYKMEKYNLENLEAQ